MTKQDYGTPFSLILAVESRWGRVVFDLAASSHNAKAPRYYTETDDSLARPWSEIQEPDAGPRALWLNPPFANITPWVKKASETPLQEDRSIIVLVPASIGSEWYAKHAYGRACTVPLRGRITFDGCLDPYPKDCMLLVYSGDRYKTVFAEPWKWR